LKLHKALRNDYYIPGLIILLPLLVVVIMVQNPKGGGLSSSQGAEHSNWVVLKNGDS
jgi:preprotein translocase subunit SecG